MHVHGGSWTDDKLLVMQSYFGLYAKALKNKRFKKWYIDAFAGTGERVDTRKAKSEDQMPLFGAESEEILRSKDGSVRIALGIDPAFDRYVFIDKADNHIAALRALKEDYPGHNIEVLSGDANIVLREIARDMNTSTTRAAIFIDPYGMQVDWETLRALSATKAVDIALLFPTGPLNRMLPKHAIVPAEWAARIDSHLGPCEWRTASYAVTPDPDLFSAHSTAIKKMVSPDGLRRFVYERLSSIFAYVCDQQLEMKNSKGAVLYHLFIICANDSEAAKRLAKRLASSAVNLPRKKRLR
jgi:three-Cys-motif partner protein